MPQKKKKKNTIHCRVSLHHLWLSATRTLKFPTKALPSELVLSRYWKIAEDTLDRPENTTMPETISACTSAVLQRGHAYR